MLQTNTAGFVAAVAWLMKYDGLAPPVGKQRMGRYWQSMQMTQSPSSLCPLTSVTGACVSTTHSQTNPRYAPLSLLLPACMKPFNSEKT